MGTDKSIQASSLVRNIKDRLRQTYGNRLCGVVLYGSSARGEATDSSDIDILVLLEGAVSLSTEIRRTIDALYDLQLEVGRPIHAIPVEANLYEAGEFSLYRNAMREGIRL
jgi:uncharacterized protein